MNSSVTAIPKDTAPPATTVDIDALDVSDRWKQYFKAARDLGGPNMPRLKQLPKEERRAAFKAAQPPIASFALAFVFGIFYYVAKGMWKKGLILLAMIVPVVMVTSIVLYMIGGEALAGATNFIGAAIFGMMAPRDFYARKMLGDEGWLPIKPW